MKNLTLLQEKYKSVVHKESAPEGLVNNPPYALFEAFGVLSKTHPVVFEVFDRLIQRRMHVSPEGIIDEGVHKDHDCAFTLSSANKILEHFEQSNDRKYNYAVECFLSNRSGAIIKEYIETQIPENEPMTGLTERLQAGLTKLSGFWKK